jgi:hypothetical protein
MLNYFAALLLSVVAVSAIPHSFGTQQKSCREHPKLVGSCFKVRGRLSVYNGAPALRIWKVGTRRMLGVSEQRFAEPGYTNIPDSIRQQLNEETVVFGDFMVCPFTRSKPGEMQLVCVEEGRNLVARKQPEAH